MITDFYEVKTAPVGYPVDFDDFELFGRDIPTADTAIVNSLIPAATEQCEKMTNRVFVNRTLTGKFVGTQTSRFEQEEFIELRRAPLSSITSISVDGSAIDSADYVVKDSSSYARVLFLSSLTPNLDLGYPIEIEFVAGYGDKDSQPDWVKTAILQTVLFWYENRGDVSPDGKQQLPLVANQILKLHKILNTYG